MENRPPPPGLRQIAEACGVSTATVSLALRNHPRFPAKTCRRIQEAAEKMGYRPNPFVAALMTHVRVTKPTRFQAVLAFINAFKDRRHDHISAAFGNYFDGAREHARKLGYQLEEFWIKEPGMTSRRLTKILYARGVSGIVVGPLPAGRGHLSLDWTNFAAAAIGYSMWRPQLHRVCHYHTHGLSLAIKNLERLGYRRIGLAMPSNFNERVDQSWLAGLLVHQKRLPADQRVPPLLESGFEMHGFPAWFRKYQPDVVVSPHGSALEWLRQLDLRVPEEVGFVHLDWAASAQECTGIDQRPEQIGATAVDLVVTELQHNRRGLPADPRLVFLEGQWVSGSTVSLRNQPSVRASAPVRRAKSRSARKPRLRQAA